MYEESSQERAYSSDHDGWSLVGRAWAGFLGLLAFESRHGSLLPRPTINQKIRYGVAGHLRFADYHTNRLNSRRDIWWFPIIM